MIREINQTYTENSHYPHRCGKGITCCNGAIWDLTSPAIYGNIVLGIEKEAVLKKPPAFCQFNARHLNILSDRDV